MAKLKPTTSTRKKAMLQALEKTLGVVTSACKIVGIDRETHYRWLKSDEKYKTAVESIGDIALDFAESQLHKSIQSGSDTATIFFLKTKGKKRGYIEKQQIEHDGVIGVESKQLSMDEAKARLDELMSGKS